MPSKVSIIILNWNGLEDTIECLESLKKTTYPNYEVIVVDNGSRGNDAQVLGEKFGDYIHIIKNDKNYGYTGGNNIAIRHVLAHSEPDYLLILNNDIVVAPDFLDYLVEVAEGNGSIGIVGPKVYYYDYPGRIQSAGGKINMWKGITPHIGDWEIESGQYNTGRMVDHISGCCLLVKSEVIQKVGLFDESYFCYWDETDYCARAKKAGYKLSYAPRARIWHKVLLNVKPWYRRLSRKDQTSMSLHWIYYVTRNNIKFMKKYATKRQYLSFLLYFFGYRFWFSTGVSLVYHRNIVELLAFYRGVRDGLFNSEARARLYTKD